MQVNLTGGEPLLRDDLEALVEEAQRLELYTNLITSGIPLTRERLERLKTARSRQRAGVDPGRHRRGVGPHRRAPIVRAQAAGRPLGEGARAAR